jgi:hypothetical protein
MPLKRMAGSQNFFVWFRGDFNLPAGSDTPSEQIPARDQTLQNKILWGYQTFRSYKVSDPAEHWQSCIHFIADACSAGSDTPQNNVLQGLILRSRKSCEVSDPTEQSPVGYQMYQTLGNNFEMRIFPRIRNRSQKYFRV